MSSTTSSLQYGRIEALHGISLHVDEGEVVALIGANGAGKTTTMRAISGLRPLAAGKIRFDGEDITSCGPTCGWSGASASRPRAGASSRA